MKVDASLVLSATALVISVVFAAKSLQLQKRLTEVEEGRDETAARPKLVCQKMGGGSSYFIRVINDGGGSASEVRVFVDREASGDGLELRGSEWNEPARSCTLSPGQWGDYQLWGGVDPGVVKGSLAWRFQGESVHEPRDFT